jgi:ribonuclease-3
MSEKHLNKIEKKIRYRFRNKDFLKTAMTHKTYAFEAQIPLEYNERLEFIGDSILGFLIAEMLYKTNKYFSEGELTRRRSQLVNNKFLAQKAINLNLGEFLYLGIGETRQNGSKKPTVLANALEALIGAIYLDSDLDTVRKFIIRTLYNDIVLS